MIEPRLTPLDPSELDDDSQSLLRRLREDVATSNVFLTLIRHPNVFRRFIAYGGELINGTLPARLRELAVLRVAVRCQSNYEWGQHVPEALSAGLSREEIAAVAEPLTEGQWSPLDHAVLTAADQLHESAQLDDRVWQELVSTLQEHAVIELILLVGHFHSVAYFLNAIRVPLDPGIDSLPIAPPVAAAPHEAAS